MLAIILVVAALLVILGGAGAFLVINNNNIKTQHDNATATANTNATANALATAHSQATAVAIATQNAITATAQVTSHYPPFTTLAFNDQLTSSDSQWSTGSSCKFTPAGYQISTSQLGFFHDCIAQTAKFSDFAYQVNMTINSGDCGGLEFRVVDANNFYILLICSNGTYNFGDFINGKASWVHNDFSQMSSSSAIHQGANQQNVIAVSVQGSAFNLFVNGSSKPVDVFTDSGNTFSQGSIGLIALDNVNPTSVTYTNAVVWTA